MHLLVHEVPSNFKLVLMQDQHEKEMKTVCFSKEKKSLGQVSKQSSAQKKRVNPGLNH